MFVLSGCLSHDMLISFKLWSQNLMGEISGNSEERKESNGNAGRRDRGTQKEEKQRKACNLVITAAVLRCQHWGWKQPKHRVWLATPPRCTLQCGPLCLQLPSATDPVILTSFSLPLSSFAFRHLTILSSLWSFKEWLCLPSCHLHFQGLWQRDGPWQLQEVCYLGWKGVALFLKTGGCCVLLLVPKSGICLRF